MEPDSVFVSYNLKFEPDPPGTPASPRPPDTRTLSQPETFSDGVLVSFEDKFKPDPPGTPASPRPPAPPREASDAVFAQELADRVREYVRAHPTGPSAEQLAALVQQLLARRSA